MTAFCNSFFGFAAKVTLCAAIKALPSLSVFLWWSRGELPPCPRHNHSFIWSGLVFMITDSIFSPLIILDWH